MSAVLHPALTEQERDTEQREEDALCNVEALSEFLLTDKSVFELCHWRGAAVSIERNPREAQEYTTDQLLALLMLGGKNVVMACRDEIRRRYLEVVL